MKANEFRIGNYHLYHIEDKLDERKEWDEVCVIDAKDLVWLSKPEGEKDKDYKPIPLTNKWLKKFGFVYFSYKTGPYGIKHKGYQIRYKAYSIHSFVRLLQLSYVKDESMYYVGKKAFNIKEETTYISCVKYVHQLQNLYFALTGNELTIQ
jgi:hypothetical protein